jgi:hypothetical protein
MMMNTRLVAITSKVHSEGSNERRSGNGGIEDAAL